MKLKKLIKKIHKGEYVVVYVNCKLVYRGEVDGYGLDEYKYYKVDYIQSENSELIITLKEREDDYDD